MGNKISWYISKNFKSWWWVNDWFTMAVHKVYFTVKIKTNSPIMLFKPYLFMAKIKTNSLIMLFKLSIFMAKIKTNYLIMLLKPSIFMAKIKINSLILNKAIFNLSIFIAKSKANSPTMSFQIISTFPTWHPPCQPVQLCHTFLDSGQQWLQKVELNSPIKPSPKSCKSWSSLQLQMLWWHCHQSICSSRGMTNTLVDITWTKSQKE